MPTREPPVSTRLLVAPAMLRLVVSAINFRAQDLHLPRGIDADAYLTACYFHHGNRYRITYFQRFTNAANNNEHRLPLYGQIPFWIV